MNIVALYILALTISFDFIYFDSEISTSVFILCPCLVAFRDFKIICMYVYDYIVYIPKDDKCSHLLFEQCKRSPRFPYPLRRIGSNVSNLISLFTFIITDRFFVLNIGSADTGIRVLYLMYVSPLCGGTADARIERSC